MKSPATIAFEQDGDTLRGNRTHDSGDNRTSMGGNKNRHCNNKSSTNRKSKQYSEHNTLQNTWSTANRNNNVASDTQQPCRENDQH